jgi:hypothetical protein
MRFVRLMAMPGSLARSIVKESQDFADEQLWCGVLRGVLLAG